MKTQVLRSMCECQNGQLSSGWLSTVVRRVCHGVITLVMASEWQITPADATVVKQV